MKASLVRGILLLLLGCSHAAIAGQPEFAFGTAERFTLQRNVVGAVAIGDANGDGRMDLAATEDVNDQIHQLMLYLQREDGTLAPPINMPLPAEVAWAVPLVFTDMDGDGADEILVGSWHLLMVARLAAGELVEAGSGRTRTRCAYVATGDINGDGHPDAVCHGTIGVPSEATLLYGDGTGGFRYTTDMWTGVGTYGLEEDFMDIRLSDATGDGLPDLLVTASRSDSFFVYPNNGYGGISQVGTAYPHPSAPAGVWPAAIETVDIDGDGINEVVTASPDNRPNGWLNIYRQGPGERLVLYQRLPMYDSTTALLESDVDGDGDGEIIAGHFLMNEVTVLGANARGIARQSRFEVPGFGNTWQTYRRIGQRKSLAIGDLDGDGCVDLAAATFTGITILPGCKPARRRVPVSDLDGDGFGDLVWRSDVFGEFQMWQWADVNIWRQCRLPCPYYKWTPWVWRAVGDFNGDGSSDVFWRNTETGENAVLLNSMWERRLATITDQDWEVVAAGDFDGDDHSDLLWRHRKTGANVIWPAGDYRRQVRLRGVTDLRWHVEGIGDFDGDGQSDVLWRHATSGRNAIWLSGRYEKQQPIVHVTDVRWHVQGVGDFDGDGEDDIAWRHVATGRNVIWRSGDYRSQQAMAGVTDLDWNIGAVADYDSDGRYDLMWRNSRTGDNVIWRSGNNETTQPVAQMDPTMSLVR